MKHIKKFNELAKFKKPSSKKVTKYKLDYNKMMSYLEKKYDFESRGFSGIPSKFSSTPSDQPKDHPYMDFWHYLTDVNEVQDGSFIIIPKDADTSSEDRISPEKMIQNYKTMMEMYPKDKEMRKNCEILISRAEEEIKNPKENPWKNWKQEITDLIYKEFAEYDKDGDGIEVWVEW